MKLLTAKRLLLAVTGLCAFVSSAIAQPPFISFQSIITGLTSPVDVVNAGDGTNRLFIVQQNGVVKVWNGSTTSDFMNLGSGGANIISFGGERGLLSLAFHPGYDRVTNRYFFVYYTDLSGNIVISRYQTLLADPNTADLSSGQVILTIPHPGQSNHNGGKLNFGPDGNLYFATGDGGGGNDVPNNAQNPASLLGKMIRINVDNFTTPPFYTVPADNPYVGDASFSPLIYNLGLRNPFRWSFDRLNGNMWIGDVGQDAREEVDFRPSASTGHNNFGWRCFEGYISTPGVADCTPPDYVGPVLDYINPPAGSSAVTGGYVYRGTDYPAFRGYYMATDVYSGSLYFLWPNGAGGFDSSVQANSQNVIVGFGEDENGRLYAVSQGTSSLYQVVATGGTPLPVTLSSFRVKGFDGYNEINWTTASEINTSGFEIQYGFDSRNFSSAGIVPASRNSNGSNYAFHHPLVSAIPVYYRLAIHDDDGSLRYSSVVKLVPGKVYDIRVYPSIVLDGVLNISATMPVEKLELINTSGAVVYERVLHQGGGSIALSLPQNIRGFVLARVLFAGGEKIEKLVIR